MGYVDSNLMPGETIVHRAKLHWLRYFWAGFWLLFGLLAVITPEGRPGGAIMLALAAFLGLLAFLDVISSEFVVTNKRVYLKQGIIRRRSTELLLSKIESLQVDQSIIGRIFDFGSIVPSGSGGTKQGFHKIAKPMVLRQRVNEQIEQSGKRAAG